MLVVVVWLGSRCEYGIGCSALIVLFAIERKRVFLWSSQHVCIGRVLFYCITYGLISDVSWSDLRF